MWGQILKILMRSYGLDVVELTLLKRRMGSCQPHRCCRFRADSRSATSQWEMALLCNDVSHWLGANLESALWIIYFKTNHINMATLKSRFMFDTYHMQGGDKSYCSHEELWLTVTLRTNHFQKVYWIPHQPITVIDLVHNEHQALKRAVTCHPRRTSHHVHHDIYIKKSVCCVNSNKLHSIFIFIWNKILSSHIPWICYERRFSEFYLSIWNQLVFIQRLQLFVQSPQPYLLIFAWRN